MSMYDSRENQPTSHGDSLVVVEGRWRPVAGVASGGVGVAGVAGGRGGRAPNESQ